MKITRFEEVEAWKEARVLVSMVYEVVDNIGYASNPSFFKTISFPSKSSGASFSLSSLENDFNKDSKKSL